MKREKADYRVGIGASSILMILVVLALATLSLLAFGSARNTEALTRRNVEMTCAYYEAEARSQEQLMRIDQAVLDFCQREDGVLEPAWFDQYEIPAQWEKTEDGLRFTLTTDAGDGRLLRTVGLVHAEADKRYTLERHVLVSDDMDEMQPYLNLIGQE